MQTWFTADLHFGHPNIIGYCRRPFVDVDEMNRVMIERWNTTVNDDDTVWVLGDLALGRIAETLPLVTELRGHKILVAGNHDRCWYGHGERSEKWVERYLDVGFERIVQGHTAIELPDGTEALVCHFPYTGDSHDEDRFVVHRPPDDGGWLLHGHVHEKWTQKGRMINVGVDVHDFAPINAEAILDRMGDRAAA